eukprot:Nitzschia sp. Nitz4//scaffold21_size171442//131466//134153//NITZ4_002183-RA/size171442-augustus-gene-0.190-mRNA-1//1//CDS//3329542477//981//frame0
MKLSVSNLVLAALIGGLALAEDASTKKCDFLPLSETTPMEISLPASTFASSKSELPIEFFGVHPLVVRKNIPYGGTPKVTISRYSGSAPELTYDEITDTVSIKSTSCASLSSTSAPAGDSATSKGTGLFSALALAAVSSINENARPMAALLAAGLAGGGFLGANAEEESCMPVVSVVVEAPQAYRSVVETCWQEFNDTTICPDPFPTFDTCDDVEPSCPVVVVGGGAGGLYSALRMVDEGLIEGSDICVFEATERVGGRLFSMRGLGPDNDLVVDSGGYRTYPQFTPTLHALITEYLDITMDCYDDSEPCEVYNIVDEEGKKAGFATFVEEMMQRLVDAGACFYPYHELTSFSQREATSEEIPASPVSNSYNNKVTTLNFANGVVATATSTTILNLPQRPLLSIIRNSDLDAVDMIDADTLDALHSVQTVMAPKLYLYYPKGQVWWRQLGIRQGEFAWDGDARNMLLSGRYHDGAVYCDDEDDPDTCHGFLLAVYTNDLSGNKLQYFRRFQRDRPEPVTILANTDLEGQEFLKHAHERLVEFHTYYNTEPAVNYTGFTASQVFANSDPPTFALLSVWNTAIPWAGGAWHSWTDLDNIEKAMSPLVDYNIFTVNEGYSLLQGWAEGTIKAADNILSTYFDIERPWDFDVVDVNQLVRQTNSEECVETSDSGSSSGGSSSGGSTNDDDDGAADAILCFAGDSMVEMADGSLKAIKDVQAGDFVATGVNGRGKGLVTEALVHPVEREVAVAVVDTAFGELVGTPDHPVYSTEKENWLELHEMEAELAVRLESRYMDAFYNLEVDGNILEEDKASHSYVVNGVTASGLGDHMELNKRFPRQEAFIEAAAQMA